MYVVGLFPSEGSAEQMAFELAVHKVNLDPTLSKDVKLEARVEIVDINDSYRTSQKGKTISTGTPRKIYDLTVNFPILKVNNSNWQIKRHNTRRSIMMLF